MGLWVKWVNGCRHREIDSLSAHTQAAYTAPRQRQACMKRRERGTFLHPMAKGRQLIKRRHRVRAIDLWRLPIFSSHPSFSFPPKKWIELKLSTHGSDAVRWLYSMEQGLDGCERGGWEGRDCRASRFGSVELFGKKRVNQIFCLISFKFSFYSNLLIRSFIRVFYRA